MKTNEVKYLIGGIIAGVAAGVLLAPKSGKETREQISESVDKVKKNALEVGENLKEHAKDLVNSEKEKSSKA